jgi:hypothetical protein
MLARKSATGEVDRLAGAQDHVLIDTDTVSLVYPAFGASLGRTVHFLPPSAGPVAIPDDVQWVVVDRIWNIIWGHPELRDMSAVGGLVSRGEPSEDDLRGLRQMWTDPRFELVYFEPRKLQAVFRRRQIR